MRSDLTSDVRQRLRELPSVDRLLAHPRARALSTRFRRTYLTRHCRELLDELRSQIVDDDLAAPLDDEALLRRLEQRLLVDARPRLRRVVNATGTLLHTNLGRALLPQAALDAIALAAAHPVALEYDLVRGVRGRREGPIERLLIDLTGAEAATVVNNNAAAVLLALNTLATGREVIVSRGELIEIGGAFRLPDIMEKSGATLREVGTTNRTHAADYERAITANTALVLKVHTSNYRIVGFSSAVELDELVAMGRAHDIPVMEDLGSGALVDLGGYALPKEPVVADRIRLGADLVTFSGDKILGGPQSGLIVGRKPLIAAIAGNPLHRALRCGKLTLAALEATLRIYQQAPDLAATIPSLNMFTQSIADIEALARRVLPLLSATLGPAFRISIDEATSQIGSGALPLDEIPTRVIAIEHDSLTADQIARRFRTADPPIIGRVHDGRFQLDLRGIFDAADVIPKWAPET
jgi:L-seryl-tRNA(Ser) seleniumtransferase